MKLYCAWSSFLKNCDRCIINQIYYYYMCVAQSTHPTEHKGWGGGGGGGGGEEILVNKLKTPPPTPIKTYNRLFRDRHPSQEYFVCKMHGQLVK